MLAQALDGSGESELRSAQSLDEVAAATDAQRLEVPQLAVHGRVAARHALAADAVARDDALALEKQLGERARVRVAREDRGGPGPAALRGGDRVGPATREATRPALRPRSLEAAAARSGCQASFVTSPAQTSSQSAGSAVSASSPVSRKRSNQKSAPPASAARMRRSASPSGGGSVAGRPSAGASSRK